MLKVALTGGIASGKSTVCNYFSKLGVPIIDADLVAKSLLEKEKIGYKTAIELFGEEILNPKTNDINLNVFRDVFFSKPNLKKQYEEYIHPIVFDEISKFQNQYSNIYTIACIPLLFEKQQQTNFNTIIVVISDASTRLTRTLKRDNVEAHQVKNIMKSQISPEEAMNFADHIIYNDADLKSLHEQIEQLHNILIEKH